MLRACVGAALVAFCACEASVEDGEAVSRSMAARAPGEISLRNVYDLSYYFKVKLGGQKVKVAFRMGTPNSWVATKEATEGRPIRDESGGHYTYPHSESTTLERLNDTFDEACGDGFWGTDVLAIDGLSVDEFRFGVVTSLADVRAWEPNPFDGVIGLGLDRDGTVPLLEAMVAAGAIEKPVFSVVFGRGKPGYLSLGSTGNLDRYEGDPRYVGLDSSKGWSVPLEALWIGDDYCDFDARRAAFDPAMSPITGPPSTVERFHREWQAERRAGMVVVPCDKDGPALSFRFDGRDYTLEKDDLITKWKSLCLLNVDKAARTTDTWTLSEPFFRKYYAIFDAAERRVGLAKARRDP
mmetsp:Transcript_53304/g.149674  ORF Transcript_53304/g.149674 Transcript_53304/m.149674 type:complete len:353 (-) Transcript_53304:109-1167(-)